MKAEYKELRGKFLAYYGIPADAVFAGPLSVWVTEWMRELCYSSGWQVHEFLDVFEKDCY